MIDLSGRPLKRLTAAKVRGNALVATLDPFSVTLTEYGTRQGYTIPWMAIYELGGKLKAKEDEREKKIAKLKEARPMKIAIVITEEQRQLILLAIAEFSLRRPGWYQALSDTALALEDRDIFESFRLTSLDNIHPEKTT